ncbi:phosphotriesterase-related protein [Belonocnema kinseyi]|uniref:phosphotriesterase-related protein n=1 Tax=Belonocnema kinseyi TaxID=2817044 RepID=UPI00143DE178|nr:phosphotriesterase-related protein [Belonocnema kinseyi]XP_033221329.1 phosphotriesterase-related protein [Belonocnema kinseyi]
MGTQSVATVLGPVNVSLLGRTLTHEHLAIDFEPFYVAPPVQLQNFFDANINIQNVGFIKQYPYSSSTNLQLNSDSEEAVLQDVKLFKEHGGGTIVENTSHGIKRNIPFMKRVSRESGVHIIAGTGHYVALTQSAQSLSNSEERMFDLIIKEMTEGCEESMDVKAGFIGEVGSAWPIEDFEKRAIRAAAAAQERLKCPISFHPGRNPSAPFEIMRIFTEAGGDPKKAIMSHLDRTLLKKEDLLEFSKLGCYCQFDLFGTECSYYQFSPMTDMPSDAQRLDKIKFLCEDGKLDKVLMSHDIHTKHRLINFGGHGYGHIINNVFPKMLIKGFTQEEIDTITITNPKTWLSY